MGKQLLLWLMVILISWQAEQAQAGTQNNCNDPYWSNTLRCKFFPNAIPQPVPAAPVTPAGIKPYTRVDLRLDPNIRCVDGTNPILYVDKAVGAASNRWLITMTGGDSCAAKDLDHNGSFEDGQACLDAYIEQNTVLMGTAFEPAMSTIADENGNGILEPDPSINPVFAGFNRVRIHKCGFDRHSGRATHLGVSAVRPPNNQTINYDLFNHGQKIVLEALTALRGHGTGLSGLSYPTWIAQGNGVAMITETLPSIADASQVVILGHSAAAHGLYQNGDRYAAFLRAMPGFNGDVRLIHDAHFMPSVENEASFDPAQNPNPLTNNSLFEQRETGLSTAAGNYDSARYHASSLSFFSEQYRAWMGAGDSLADVVDASCYASHASQGDEWKCKDRFHVRLHHQSTAALVREDFADPNGEHTNNFTGYPTYWGEILPWPYCLSLFGQTSCAAYITDMTSYRARLAIQARHFLAGVHSRSELATGADNSGPLGTVYLWMPYCSTHEGVYSNPQFYQTSLVKNGQLTTYRKFIEQFIQAPATGQVLGLVHQLDGALSECGPWLLKNGFE